MNPILQLLHQRLLQAFPATPTAEQLQAMECFVEFMTDCSPYQSLMILKGSAGTGKTTFLRTLVEKSTKQMVVVAPTGVAAMNAGGMTIHSFFQLPLSPYVPGAQVKNKYDFSKEKRKIISSLDLLISTR